MQGERLSAIDIVVHGVIGDRAYALREANGRVVTAKNGPICSSSARAMTYHPRSEPGAAPHHLPDGRTVQAQAPDASVALSAVLGRPVVLERAQSDQPSHAEIDPATLFGDVAVEQVLPERTAATMPDSFALPPGTFFDSGSIHVLASGTLAHLRTLIGTDAQLDPCRFRPNIFVETEPGVAGFMEDSWLEGVLEVGESVQLVQMRPTLRCVMTTHPKPVSGVICGFSVLPHSIIPIM